VLQNVTAENLSTGKMVETGEAVGIIAAQSIGVNREHSLLSEHSTSVVLLLKIITQSQIPTKFAT